MGTGRGLPRGRRAHGAWWSAVVFCALLIFPAGPAAAQHAAVRVRVAGEDGPLEAARVELMRGETVVRAAETDSAGLARLVGVVPGEYRLQVGLLGYRSQILEGLRLAAGEPRVIELRLDRAPVELEGIAVRADRIRIQPDNTEFNTTVPEEAIELLPIPYVATELAALVPGARAENVWGGANYQANAYMIDGLSANHPGLGGALLQPSPYWIERFEVRGLGAGAEHGGFQGAQVDLVLKRGGSEFDGALRTRGEHAALSASSLVETETAPETVTRFDIEGEAGGPIVPDRLFYFAGGSYARHDARFLNHLPDPDGTYLPTLEERSDWRTFGRLTWVPARADRIDLSVAHYSTRADNYGMTGHQGSNAAQDFASPTWFTDLAWRHAIGDRAILEARLNRVSRDEHREPYGGTAAPGVRLFTLTPPYTDYGNAPFAYHSASGTTSARLSGTVRVKTGRWEHSIKVGVEHSLGAFIDRRTRTGGMTWRPVESERFDPTDPTTWTHPSQGFIPTEWGGNVHIDADVSNTAVFAQGSITLGRLVLTPGLRWGSWTGWIDPVADERFRAVSARSWDPRVGATLDLTGRGATILKAHWGRYHQNMITQMFDRAAGADAFTDEEIWYFRGDPPDRPGRVFTAAERDTLARQGLFTLESVVTLNETGPVEDYRQPYMDQWIVGLEHRIGSARIELTYTRRTNHDMIALVDRNRASNYTRYPRVRIYGESPVAGSLGYRMSELYLPNDRVLDYLRTCAATAGCEPVAPLQLADTLALTWDPDLVVTTAPDARRTFGQLALRLELVRPRWGGSLSVAATDLRGNLDNVSGYTDPRSYGPGPYVRVNEGVNAYGTLPNFSDREAKVSLWGLLPGSLRAGVFWTYRSGDHYAGRFRLSSQGFYSYRAFAGARETDCSPWDVNCVDQQVELPIALFPTLEGHRVFVGQRGSERMRVRAQLDVRLERRFPVGDTELGLSLEVFNVMNARRATSVQTLVNNHPRLYYFVDADGNPVRANRAPAGEYFEAVLSRQPPRTFRIGSAFYF